MGPGRQHGGLRGLLDRAERIVRRLQLARGGRRQPLNHQLVLGQRDALDEAVPPQQAGVDGIEAIRRGAFHGDLPRIGAGQPKEGRGKVVDQQRWYPSESLCEQRKAAQAFRAEPIGPALEEASLTRQRRHDQTGVPARQSLCEEVKV